MTDNKTRPIETSVSDNKTKRIRLNKATNKTTNVALEVDGVIFHSLQEMLVYMTKQKRRIEELEKENEYLRENKTDLENKYINTAYQLEGRELKLKELRDNYEQYKAVAEPEIARLKSIILDNQMEINTKQEIIEQLEKQQRIESNEKLYKAKTIIREFIKWFTEQTEQSKNWQKTVEEAEKFLEE